MRSRQIMQPNSPGSDQARRLPLRGARNPIFSVVRAQSHESTMATDKAESAYSSRRRASGLRLPHPVTPRRRGRGPGHHTRGRRGDQMVLQALPPRQRPPHRPVKIHCPFELPRSSSPASTRCCRCASASLRAKPSCSSGSGRKQDLQRIHDGARRGVRTPAGDPGARHDGP